MNIEDIKAAAEVLITWGFWIVVYGLVTMAIGAVILVSIAALSKSSKPISKPVSLKGRY